MYSKAIWPLPRVRQPSIRVYITFKGILHFLITRSEDVGQIAVLAFKNPAYG